jgi:FkbM family methyltransferase
MVENTEHIVEEVRDNDPVPDELQDGEIVLEAGAYEGAWALKVCEKHPNCKVYAFEPATRAYEVAKAKLEGYDVVLLPFALGKQAAVVKLCDRDRDGANTYDHNPESEPSEMVSVVDVADIVEPQDKIALMHLNAEGGEVDILERLIETGLIERVKMILAQWHPYDDEMRERICIVVTGLHRTHEYENRHAWGCWKRRGGV